MSTSSVLGSGGRRGVGALGAATLLALVGAPSARAQAPATPEAGGSAASSASAAPSATSSASSTTPAPSAAPAGSAAAPEVRLCTEVVPPGKERPVLRHWFPQRGEAGHVARLEIELEHYAQERPMPRGLGVAESGDHSLALRKAGFVVPHPEGAARPELVTEPRGERALTRIALPFLLLPKEGGPHLQTLPSLPVTLQRASGEVLTVCTTPHTILVEDPTRNTPHAPPRPNPPPERQREIWEAARTAAIAAAVALPVGVLAAGLVSWWRRRPLPLPPPPPARPPWEVAIEALERIRREGLTTNGEAAHFDRVSDVVRRYLGDRYGFDGLETTSREMLAVLRRVVPPIPVLDEIEAFLRQADLVKFARLTPTEAECHLLLERGSAIVHRTVPRPGVAPADSGLAPPEAP